MNSPTVVKRIDPPVEEPLDVRELVQQLRALREASLAARQRVGRPTKLPSRRVLAKVVAGIAAAFFPNRLGAREFTADSVDFFVGNQLDHALRRLTSQVRRELRFMAASGVPRDAAQTQAQRIVREFSRQLPTIRALLETDLQAGIDIHPGAQIQGSFFIDHGTGVVIGETAVIGQRVRLYHGVTLGAKRFEVAASGELVKGNARHPIVEDDVVIYAGATILGRITLGQGSTIGGNVWLTRSIPPGSHVSQAKLRSESDFNGGSGI